MIKYPIFDFNSYLTWNYTAVTRVKFLKRTEVMFTSIQMFLFWCDSEDTSDHSCVKILPMDLIMIANSPKTQKSGGKKRHNTHVLNKQEPHVTLSAHASCFKYC